MERKDYRPLDCFSSDCFAVAGHHLPAVSAMHEVLAEKLLISYCTSRGCISVQTISGEVQLMFVCLDINTD